MTWDSEASINISQKISCPIRRLISDVPAQRKDYIQTNQKVWSDRDFIIVNHRTANIDAISILLCIDDTRQISFTCTEKACYNHSNHTIQGMQTNRERDTLRIDQKKRLNKFPRAKAIRLADW